MRKAFRWLGLIGLTASARLSADEAPTVEQLLPKAQAGEVSAMVELGDTYHGSDNPDEAKALAWYRRAAEKGSAIGQFDLASMLDAGSGTPEPKPAEAFQWYLKSATQGHLPASRVVAEFYENGHGTPPNPGEALRWRRKVAENADAYGDDFYQLGLAYAEGRGLNAPNVLEAVKWIQRAADQESSEALEKLDELAAADPQLGARVALAAPPATKQVMAKAAQGDARAQFELGTMELERKGGLLKNPAEGFKWIEQAAQQGFAAAQESLGSLYADGLVVAADPVKAVAWWRKAAAQKFPAAQYRLGRAYETGESVTGDKAEAVRWYRLAAEQDNMDAQLALGQLHRYGDTPPAADARKWYLRAAEHGNERAMMELGFIYQEQDDFPNARKWFKAAADKGDPEGESRLANVDDLERDSKDPVLLKEKQEQLAQAARAEADQVAAAQQEAEKATAAKVAVAEAERSKEAARKAGEQTLKELPERFAVEFATAGDVRRRKQAVEHLASHFYELGLSDAAAADFILGLIIPQMEAHPDEAYAYVSVLNPNQIKNEVVFAKVSPATKARIQSDAKKVVDHYEPLRLALNEKGDLSSRAGSGDATAAYEMGNFYLDNRVARDVPSATFWFEKAAALGNAKAKEVLTARGIELYNAGAKAYTAGHKLEALRDFLLADEYGVKQGRMFIGLIYTDGADPVKADPGEAVKWWEKAAADLDPDATTMLALAYASGRGVTKDPGRAFLLAAGAADRGQAGAQRLVGIYYLRGFGTKVDETKARELLQPLVKDTQAAVWLKLLTSTSIPEDRAALALDFAGSTVGEYVGDIDASGSDLLDYAAELGNAEAKRIRSLWHERPLDDSHSGEMALAYAAVDEKKYDEALRNWRIAADGGNPLGMVEIGRMYHAGEGVPRDFATARTWYEKAAKAGLLAGFVRIWQLELDVLDLQGIEANNAQKYTEALAIKQSAAALGGKVGLYRLGEYYERPPDGAWPADPAKALAYYRRAASLGLSDAKEAVEFLQATMVGTAEIARAIAAIKAGNAEQARVEYEAAARLGNAHAMEQLGELYADGIFLAHDDKKALEWFKKAAALGDSQAAMQAAKLEKTAYAEDQKTKQKLNGLKPAPAIADAPVKPPVGQNTPAPAPMVTAAKPAPAIPASKPPAATPEELLKKAESGDPQAQLDYAAMLNRKGDSRASALWYKKARDNPRSENFVRLVARVALAALDEAENAPADVPAAAKKSAPAATSEPVATPAAKPALAPLSSPKPLMKESDADDHLANFKTFAGFDDTKGAADALKLAVDDAEEGNPETKYRLADVLMRGTPGILRSPERARALLLASCKEGFRPAQLAYAQALLSGGLGFKQDVMQGTALLAKLVADAEKSEPEVKHQVAMILFKGGYGVAADRPRSLRLLEYAAATESLRESQYELGRALLVGIPPDLAADPKRGIDLLNLAANQKFPLAFALLGQLYEKGTNVPADPGIALYWYKRADGAGVAGAKEAIARVQQLLPPPLPANQKR